MAANKKSKKSTSKREKFTSKKTSNNKTMWVIGALVVGAIAAAVVVSSGGGQKSGQASPEEQKYIGRFLPAGYQPPKLTENISYTTTQRMFNSTSAQNDKELSIPVGDVITNRIVYFEYQKASAQPLSMIAFMKPSGKLFVGVSYCPPCQGKYQRIESDGTLTCETCGTKRELETQVGISGPCKLYPLDEFPSKVVGDKIVVEKSELDKWTQQPMDRKVGG